MHILASSLGFLVTYPRTPKAGLSQPASGLNHRTSGVSGQKGRIGSLSSGPLFASGIGESQPFVLFSFFGKMLVTFEQNIYYIMAVLAMAFFSSSPLKS